MSVRLRMSDALDLELDRRELPRGCRELNPGPLEKQPVFSQPLNFLFSLALFKFYKESKQNLKINVLKLR